MGLFDLFGKKSAPEKRPVSAVPTRIEKIIQNSDKAIADMQNADAAFEKDGDLEKRIAVYEKYLLSKPEWNSFNFSISLAKMYVKAGRNNDAWSYLNQMYMWSIDPSAVGGDASKVRFEQFKILKTEKKLEDAMVMLVSSYVLNAYSVQNMYFNKEKFIKDAKTTFKSLGFSDLDLQIFSDSLEKDIKAKRIKEDTTKDFCTEFYKKHGSGKG